MDDEPDFLVIMEKLLKKHGYDVIEAINGKSGLKKAQENHPDLILLDIMMSDISGWEVARKLKKDPETRDIPIIMLTVMTEEGEIKRSFEYAGAEWHITKPFDTDVFFAVLDMAALRSTELEKRIEEAIERDKKMKQVFDMINPKLLDYKYDFLNRK
ncbi:MAG: response regulator [Methanobacteriota archaeon]|nr:MAG: response regulator [Euryarchaeota archaeon]